MIVILIVADAAVVEKLRGFKGDKGEFGAKVIYSSKSYSSSMVIMVLPRNVFEKIIYVG